MPVFDTAAHIERLPTYREGKALKLANRNRELINEQLEQQIDYYPKELGLKERAQETREAELNARLGEYMLEASEAQRERIQDGAAAGLAAIAEGRDPREAFEISTGEKFPENFDLDEMQSAVTEIFSSLEGDEYKNEEPSTKVESYTPQNIDHFMLRDQVVFLLGQPSSLTIDNPDLIPIKLLNIVSFSSLGSRLFELREATGMFYTATGVFGQGAAKEHGFDFMYVILSPDKLQEVEKQVKVLINEIGRKGIVQKELDVARRIYMKSLIDLSGKNENVANQLGRLETLGLGTDYFDKAIRCG